MSEPSELSKAIIAAADREFSTFKDVIGDALEQRFRDKIDNISKEKANKIFNPEYIDPELEDDDSDDDDSDDDNLDDDNLDDVSDDAGDDDPEDPKPEE
ncbi:MAG: hypothetical protein U9Q40_05650 [Campylobacterota bacterium]|nr:hypothetical protein [Campylobacterota bacterium]